MKPEERERLEQLYELERELASAGYAVVAGVDEVGRGPIAGPVTAAACILPPHPVIEMLNDSKKLTVLRRDRVAAAVRTVAVSYAVAHIGADVVDEIGIVPALRRAMLTALDGLSVPPSSILLDGNDIGLGRGEQPIVRGDARVACIAAASVLAKVARDALMVELDSQYPQYGFAGNKGYGSAAHIEAIRHHGLTPQHRQSFCTRIVS